MKKQTLKRFVSIGLCATMAVSMFTGCGESEKKGAQSTSSHGGPYEEFLTIDVFDSQANFQGIQTGWFAKVVKDKFNMELNIIAPNVAGGGDTLYQTRSANGNLGDIIITNSDSGRLKDLVSAGLVLDMTPYLDNCENLNKYADAIADMEVVAGTEGTWAVPSEISNQPATEPCDAANPTNAPSIRWDIYERIGSPEMGTLEDVLDVMEAMQAEAGQSDSGKDVYAFSLFKDWDGDIMQNAGGICALYGYEPQGFCMAKDDGTDIQSVIDENGIYVRALKFLFTANQRGLVDPESTTQNFDNLTAKYQDGGVLYSLWPWLGNGQYNNAANTAEGKGFAIAIIDDMECATYGSMPKGKMSTTIMVGSQTKDPQRMVDFIDWLYSPEGVEMSAAASGSTCGPQGLTWDIDENGNPYLTEFGVKAFIESEENLQVPEEWGTGTWADGISALNYKAVGVVDVDEATGICYNYQKWDDYLERTATTLSKNWSTQHDNAGTALEYLKNNNMLVVRPGSNYATPEYSTDIQTIKEQCKQVIVSNSWQMVFAKDEAEFNSLLKEMQDTVNGLGYQDVYAVDEQNCKDRFAAEAEVSK
ncbi:MAG: ABC transporter substrate-binding protein [Agathobacter sp.]